MPEEKKTFVYVCSNLMLSCMVTNGGRKLQDWVSNITWYENKEDNKKKGEMGKKKEAEKASKQKNPFTHCSSPSELSSDSSSSSSSSIVSSEGDPASSGDDDNDKNCFPQSETPAGSRLCFMRLNLFAQLVADRPFFIRFATRSHLAPPCLASITQRSSSWISASSQARFSRRLRPSCGSRRRVGTAGGSLEQSVGLVARCLEGWSCSWWY